MVENILKGTERQSKKTPIKQRTLGKNKNNTNQDIKQTYVSGISFT